MTDSDKQRAEQQHVSVIELYECDYRTPDVGLLLHSSVSTELRVQRFSLPDYRRKLDASSQLCIRYDSGWN